MTANAENRKRERLEARVNSETKEAIVRAAEMQGLSVSDFVVQAAFQSAQSVIETQTVIRLSARDAERFISAMDNPPEAGPVLQSAVAKHRAYFQGS